MLDQPVFIVGAPRSGTTLLSAFLANHSEIACGPETHFFRRLNPNKLRSAIEEVDWPKKAVNEILSLKLSRQPVYELFELTPGEIDEYLTCRSPSITNMLESLTLQHAQKKDKKCWVEKTPNHLLHLPTIRKAFPQAFIVRIIRDPRDSAVSMRKLPWASQSVLANCYLWSEWFNQSHDFCEDDKGTLTIRYEDLVLEPEATLRKVCNHIHRTFEPSMMDTSKSAHNVITPKEPWKLQVSQPLDPSRLYAWKKNLPNYLYKPATYACQSGIEAFGYDFISKPKSTVFLYKINRNFVEKNEYLFINAASSDKRISTFNHKLSNHISSDEDFVFCSLPESGKSIQEQISRTISLFLCLARRRLKGRSSFYLTTLSIPEGEITKKIQMFLLRALGSEISSI
ncbi:Sulfotransferase domain family [Synechococcus sp. PCC 7335]|uniref:sulfotransferase family protein n=1 Tax=Synechococcus sp. (strain ATCC 29403 / PCC 7335) TaxID=91464 RepID=UPI00017ED1ED|nr:sulfotransferase [Synechococcus sp. PCC 7335]EDX86781.1 Sulfotransferase domain family [Synechococcus sp. PCC 7335]